MHTNAPVNHGGVAGVDVDANTVPGFGVSGAADGVQALRRTAGAQFRWANSNSELALKEVG